MLKSTRVGVARRDITVFEPEMTMLGWGLQRNRIHGVTLPVMVRAMVIRRAGRALAYLCTDQCFAAPGVRAAVIERLRARGFGHHNLCWTATHTHSAPSGYCQYALHIGVNFGFSPMVFDALVERLVEAVEAADDSSVEASLRVGEAQIPEDEPVAFNRALVSWRNNPEARTSAAVSRTTVTLRADDRAGRCIGLINWFAVHGTSVHSDNTRVHADNKGYAAAFTEAEAARRPDVRSEFVAIFAQEAAGDISPNDRWSTRRWLRVGRGATDDESARINGRIQSRWALKAWSAAEGAAPLDGPLAGGMRRTDFRGLAIDPEYTGRSDCRTSIGILGAAMAGGTAEGPGPLRPLLPMLGVGSRLAGLHATARGRPADPKLPFLELGLGADGHLFGRLPIRAAMRWVGPLEPMFAFAAAAEKAGELGHGPWAPQILPVQIIRIGSLAIVALPVEPTTVSGARIRETARAALGPEITRVIVNGYANAYSGYVTTPEEYRVQRYEGAYTLFGPWTLPAYRMAVRELAADYLSFEGTDAVPGPLPPPVDRDALIRQRKAGRLGVAHMAGSGQHVARWTGA